MEFKDHQALQTLQNLAAPVWVFDTERYGIWWANAQALSFWQADSLEELSQRDFSTDSSSVRRRLSTIHSFGTEAPVRETWTLYPQGAPRRVLLSFQPITIAQGRQALLIEVVRHQEDPSGDQETIRVSEASRVADFHLSTFTLEGALLGQNPSAAVCYGRGPGSAELQRRLGDADLAAELLRRVAEGDEFATEADMCTQAGPKRHLLSLRAGRDPYTGETIAVLSEQDITELAAQRRAQEDLNAQLTAQLVRRTQQLEQSQRRYELALATAAIWDWNLEADRFFLSNTLCAALGYTPAEMDAKLGGKGLHRLERLMHTADVAAFRNAIAGHLADAQQSLQVEFRLFAQGGGTVWFRAEGNCLRGDGGPQRSVGLLTNITKRKRLEAKLMSAQRLEAVGQLTGGVAHDFNNLLTVILGNAELMQELQSYDPALLREISGAVQRGAQLTGQLLSFARKQTLTPQSQDLNALLDRLRETLLRTLRENIRVEVHAAPGLWDVVADPAQLESAILNIALNARDAMPEGGTLVIACTNHSAAEDLSGALPEGRFVELRFSDTGCGIPDDVLPKVFEPFFSTKDVGQGSGLGLSMVKGFAQQSGGNCTLHSTPGAGTEVTLLLPASLPAQKTAESQQPPQLQRGKGQHIHIVDDDAAVRQSVVRSVAQLGYRVSWSETAQDALSKLAEGLEAEVFLIDVVLPGGMSGTELAEHVQRLRPEAQLFLMSGHPGIYAADVRGSDLPLLRKPFDRTELSRLLVERLNRKAGAVPTLPAQQTTQEA